MGKDFLTGLPEVRSFYNILKEWRKQERNTEQEGELTVLYFDLVNFRQINLRYGLAAGDEFLQQMSKSLVDSFPYGVVSHINGDIFLVLTDDLMLEERAANAREKLRTIFPISMECSIGACVWDDHTLEPEEVCHLARLASDENRKHIHTYFSRYSKEMGEQMQTSEYVVSHIDEAVQHGWIKVYYQPIIRALTNQLCGMEALARWENPQGGMLAPADFIRPLEETRLIWKLDLCIIRQVVSQIAERYRRGILEIPVSINLSRLDFLYCNIFQEIEHLVQLYDIPRRMLHIEITESVMTSCEDIIIRALDSFRRVGYEIWMDDFGSGYSTLNLLKDYSFDVLKLDMLFLKSTSSRSRKIIAAVIQMDKDIGNRTLAEGVETEEQAEFLKKAGCDKLQGYYFGKPAPFEEMLRNCISKGIGIESTKQKVCYDQVSSVDFRTDVPLILVETRGQTFTLLFMNDRALEMIHRDGVADKQSLEDRLNDRNDLVSQELNRAVSYMVLSEEKSGEMAIPFDGKARLLLYRLLGKYGDTRLFAVKVYGRSPAGEAMPLKTQIMMNLLYFDKFIFRIDPEKMTIQNIRYTEKSMTRGNVLPIRSKGGYSPLLPDIIEMDRKRYDAFLYPETLKSRLEQAKSGILMGAFRTKNSEGMYVWMIHKILLAPNSDGRMIFYVISGMSEQEAELHSSWIQKPQAASNTKRENVGEETIRKAALFDSLMRYLPVGVFWKDGERRFEGASQYFLDYYGLSSESEILGKTDEDMEWHPNNDSYKENEEEILASGGIHYNVPGKCISKGEARTISASKWPVYQNGKITGLMGYFLDTEEAPLTTGKGRKAGPGTRETNNQSEFNSLSRFMDDLNAYEKDYKLNKRTYGVIYIQIPDLTRIAQVYDREAMNAAARVCFDVIAKAAGNMGSTHYFGLERFAIVGSYNTVDRLRKISQQIQQDIDAIREIDGLPCSLYAKVKVLPIKEVDRIRRHVINTLYNAEEVTEEADSVADAEEALRSILSGIPIGCYILRADHTVVYWNNEAENILGYSAEEMLGKRCVEMPLGCSFTNGDYIPYSSCPAVVAYTTGKKNALIMFMRHKNGHEVLLRNMMAPLKDAEGNVTELISLFTPLADNGFDEDMLRNFYKRATLDAVTCLPDRRYMEVCLGEAMALYRRTGQKFAVLFADVDNFHDVNNNFGHRFGDVMLREIAAAFKKYARKTDRFCRWGGDEFVGVLEVKDPQAIEGAAERFLNMAGSVKVTVDGQNVQSRTAIGITLVREDDDVNSVVSRADDYMFQAKKRKDRQIVTDFNADSNF